MVHQRGVVDVMNWIRQETHAGNVTSLGVLMPCHSTPWTSSVHHPLFQDRSKTWFITCEPPLGHTDPKSYKDESDLFYEDPVSYMDSHNIGQAESHIIIFEDLWNTFPATKTWFVDHGYQECARFFNSHFHDDSRRRGDVVALCKV
ncbi:glycosylphosphatidylinositol anchor biosynthesis [Actinomortierella wolfii]|nr:glycosylphosphatidylinositol anchor biosynthesis [Actinomortierella wolfii]